MYNTNDHCNYNLCSRAQARPDVSHCVQVGKMASKTPCCRRTVVLGLPCVVFVVPIRMTTKKDWQRCWRLVIVSSNRRAPKAEPAQFCRDKLHYNYFEARERTKTH